MHSLILITLLAIAPLQEAPAKPAAGTSAVADCIEVERGARLPLTSHASAAAVT
jgi:hypothetical protein